MYVRLNIKQSIYEKHVVFKCFKMKFGLENNILKNQLKWLEIFFFKKKKQTTKIKSTYLIFRR